MIATKPEVDLSPLEQIRQCEAEMTRQVLTARESAEKAITRANQDAAKIKEKAREAGNREGQVRSRESVSKAAEEAELIVSQAKRHAEELRRKGDTRMEAGVSQAVKLVIGMEKEERGENER